ncbi:exportin-5 [Nematolebias whitei]|uniref:exportin-5 n=1 Tax=Nematolebias whitei TaxID=451745 RepID=UPI00189977B4|nr:exportin-5 [Nematolebias whitei]
MTDQVAATCDQLIKAVVMIMDAETIQNLRTEALKFCEEFKETSILCVPCGLQLADKTQPAVVRHFGLQILEHVIKFRWNNMQQEEKVQLKDCAMQLLSNGTRPILEEESHVKDALSRITVEMIKREWPQNWPDMLKEMEALSSQGEAQTELVMMILLRLAEDVITFQTLPTQRRRDIQQTLTQNMDSIFSFIMAILQIHVEDYCKVKQIPGHELQARAHCRVAVATLNTLAGYIDWVSLLHITSGNCKLLEMLCLLLSEPDLQLEASECLLIALSRKGKLEERKPFMLLFDDVAINFILSAAQSADCLAISPSSLESQGVEVVERRYIFLKRLCQVLCALGFQLCSLVGSNVKAETPANLCKYIDALFAFTMHSSVFLKSCTVPIWTTLFKHETLSKVTVVVEMAMKYLKASMSFLIRSGFPSRNDSPSCGYSRMDFDNDQDFNLFFTSYRSQQGDVVRCISRILPLEAFRTAADVLRFQIASPIDPGDATSKTAEGMCSLLSPSVIQWDAATVFMEAVMSQIIKNLEEEKLPIDESMALLQVILNYETRDPLILYCVLSNLFALFPFVVHRPQFVPQVLSKLTKVITFETTVKERASWTRAVKNVRRHACSSIIRICKDYPQQLLPFFDLLYNDVKMLFSGNIVLTYLEKCSMIEALVLLCNQFKDFEKQKAFIDKLVAPMITEWTSEEMKSVIWHPVKFLSFVGADQVVTEKSDTDAASLNRWRLSFCLFAMLAVVRRSRWPADLEEAKAGGFVVGYTPAGAPIHRNPCTAQFLAFFPNLLALARTQNSLFTPENLARLSETFTRAFDVMEGEKNMILSLFKHPLDIYGTPVQKSSLEHMQGFFSSLYESCFHNLGAAAAALQQDFYAIDKLCEGITGSVFSSLDHLTDHRLRPMLRLFVKPIVISCPPEFYESLLCPLLGPLFSYMLQRLNSRWQVISQRTSINEDEEEQELCQDSQVTQEMLEEEILRLLTREVLDLLVISCISKKVPEPAANKEEIDEEEMMMMDSAQLGSSPQHTEELTEFGKCLIKDENTYMSLLTLAFTSLSWKDATNCHRTASIACWTLLRQVVDGNLLPDAVTWFYTSVLKGLYIHGQHDICNATLSNLALLIYENLRPRYLELRTVMTQIPNIHVDSLDLFDQRLLDPRGIKFGDKKKKDQFKKLIAGIVGKALGQQFRKEVHIRNLPSLFKRPKPDKDVAETESLGLAALFAPENDAM